MKRRSLLIAPLIGLVLMAVGCHDSSQPARTGGNEKEREEPSADRHERFKSELREATQSVGAGMERAQVKTRNAVRHGGQELGIRKEVLGTPQGSADAGAGD